MIMTAFPFTVRLPTFMEVWMVLSASTTTSPPSSAGNTVSLLQEVKFNSIAAKNKTKVSDGLISDGFTVSTTQELTSLLQFYCNIS
jgi:hypothetical protein